MNADLQYNKMKILVPTLDRRAGDRSKPSSDFQNCERGDGI